MATNVIMPHMGLTTVEGTIVKWLKKEGDTVKKDEPLVEVLTDKVNNIVEAPEAGVLLKIVAPEGAVVPVTESLCWIGQAGEAIPEAGKAAAQPAAAPEPAPAAQPTPATSAAQPAAAPAPEREATPEGAFDVVIIGSGPAGYVAAIRAAQLGGKVAIVERDSVGGTCLNRGCIPTKALHTSVEVLHHCRDASQFGVQVGEAQPDMGKMIVRKDQIVNRLVKGVEFLLGRAKVEVVRGEGTIVDPRLVEVRKSDGSVEQLKTRTIMIATGSESAQIPVLPFDGQAIISSTEALQMKEIPASMLIVGAGAIGLEFACILRALGTDVTVVEMLPQVLPAEDKEIAELLERELGKQKIKVLTNARVEKAGKKNGKVAVALSTGDTITVDKVLVAAGRALNTKDIGLEKIGVTLEKRAIKVNERMETNVKGVYAIGDVVGGWLLAHVGSKEGMVAAENIMGVPAKIDYRVVPRSVWSNPEVASVGMTEQEAIDAGYTVKVGKFPFRGLGKAVAMGETEGLVKLVGDAKTDELLGAQMIGPRVTDLIAEVAVAMQLETTVEEVAKTIHAHPTLPEAIMEAAHALHGQAVHI